jgi:hypothetical protein
VILDLHTTYWVSGLITQAPLPPARPPPQYPECSDVMPTPHYPNPDARPRPYDSVGDVGFSQDSIHQSSRVAHAAVRAPPRSRSPIHRVLHSTPEYPRKGPSASPEPHAARAHRWACPTRGHRGRGCLLWPYRQCGAGPARRATRRSASGSSSTPSSTVGDRQLRLHSRWCTPMVLRRCSAALRSRRCRDRAGGWERGTRVLTAGGRAEAAARLDAALALGTHGTARQARTSASGRMCPTAQGR